MPQFEFFHTFLLSVDVVFDQRNKNQNKCMEKFKIYLDAFVCGYMPQIFVFGSSLVTLKFSIHNFF